DVCGTCHVVEVRHEVDQSVAVQVLPLDGALVDPRVLPHPARAGDRADGVDVTGHRAPTDDQVIPETTGFRHLRCLHIKIVDHEWEIDGHHPVGTPRLALPCTDGEIACLHSQGRAVGTSDVHHAQGAAQGEVADVGGQEGVHRIDGRGVDDVRGLAERVVVHPHEQLCPHAGARQ